MTAAATNYIYVYQTPRHEELGLVKVGDAFDVEARIGEQLNTAAVVAADQLQYRLLYKRPAIRVDGTLFRDHQIHEILIDKGYNRHVVEDDAGAVVKHTTEAFKIEPERVAALIDSYILGTAPGQIDVERHLSFSLRPEQAKAVEFTSKAFQEACVAEAPVEVLWNAKMRFGKTFTTYQLCKSRGYKRVLVATYKPAVEDEWRRDLLSHQDFREYRFLSGAGLESLPDLGADAPTVCFVSYQDLLGAGPDNAIKRKHVSLFEQPWDLIVIDEFHYGASSDKAQSLLSSDVALEAELVESSSVTAIVEKSLQSPRRLFLSGTPFKAIASGRFSANRIFNWTYVDEQREKLAWGQSGKDNPYQQLPRINLFAIELSEELMLEGAVRGKDEFSLNQFFETDTGGEFKDAKAVRAWLDNIAGLNKPVSSIAAQLDGHESQKRSLYPFDPASDFRIELSHTLWYLQRVSSAIALSRMLEEHPVFCSYHVIVATGDGSGSGKEALRPVRRALAKYARTITLTVGKLTTGVSVPEWSGILFLLDLRSPEAYFQAAFRAQTPRRLEDGSWKPNCYVFDFSPNRSFKLLVEYSKRLLQDGSRKTVECVAEFLRYLPVLQFSGNQMVALSAVDVLDFELKQAGPAGLAQRFLSDANIDVSAERVSLVCSNGTLREEVQSILDRIKAYRKFQNIKATDQDVSANVLKLHSANNRVKALNTRRPVAVPTKAEAQAEKTAAVERENMRVLLRTLVSRLPIFMYLTDEAEDRLDDVLIDEHAELFRKTTGITTMEFRVLLEAGLLEFDTLDGYVRRFLALEQESYQVLNAVLGVQA